MSPMRTGKRTPATEAARITFNFTQSFEESDEGWVGVATTDVAGGKVILDVVKAESLDEARHLLGQGVSRIFSKALGTMVKDLPIEPVVE